MKLQRKIAILLASGVSLLVVCLLLVGCGGGPHPKDTVVQFASEASDMDLEGMLDCCNQETNDTVDGLISIGDGALELVGLGSIDTRAVIMAFLPFAQSAYDYQGEDLTISVQATDLEEEIIDDTHARVTGTWVFSFTTGGNTEEGESPFVLDLEKEGDEWKLDLTDEIYDALFSLIGY